MAKSTSSVRRDQWTTYAVTGYTYQAGTDGRATGGVHLHQIKRLRRTWAKRIVDSNGRFESAGPVTPVAEADGECYYEQAANR